MDVPSGRSVTVSFAKPVGATAAAPTVLVPTVNVTVPDGAPDPGDRTVIHAVRMIGDPTGPVLGSAVTTVAVAALSTLTAAFAADGWKFASPGYVAVIWFGPIGRADVVNVATPAALRWPEPSVVEPFVNTTVPVGAPEAGATGATCAVIVTC
jgi:hypothetical protein